MKIFPQLSRLIGRLNMKPVAVSSAAENRKTASLVRSEGNKIYLPDLLKLTN